MYFLFCFRIKQCCCLVPDENYHIITYKCSEHCTAICGKNFNCGDTNGGSLLENFRRYEIADQIVGYLMLAENILQTGIVYFEFVCKPSKSWLVIRDNSFEWMCVVDWIFILFTFISYLISHRWGSCKMCLCDYPYTWCPYVLGALAWIAIMPAIPAIILLFISATRSEKRCVLMRG